MTGSHALVVGEALIDLVVRDGRDIGSHVGGSPLNVAVGLARLGRPVEFFTSLGRDEHGRRIGRYLDASGVGLAEGSISATRTATSRAVLDECGSAAYEFDIAWRPRPAGFATPLVLHTGSIAAVLAPGCEVVSDLIDRHAPGATITFDPNLRPRLIEDMSIARTRVESLVARADVVKASDEDLRVLEPGRSPEDVAAQWLSQGAGLSQGPALVVVTLGADGAFALSRAGSVRVPAVPATVVDTVGAGDAFTTGLIDALWRRGLLGGAHRKALRDIGSEALHAALEVASRSSAATVSRSGAAGPGRE